MRVLVPAGVALGVWLSVSAPTAPTLRLDSAAVSAGPFRIVVPRTGDYSATPTRQPSIVVKGELVNPSLARNCTYNVAWDASAPYPRPPVFMNGFDSTWRPIAGPFESSREALLLAGLQPNAWWNKYCGAGPQTAAAREIDVSSTLQVRVNVKCSRLNSREQFFLNAAVSQPIQATVVCPGTGKVVVPSAGALVPRSAKESP